MADIVARALALKAQKGAMPEVSDADIGKVAVVGADGWTTGEVTGATITVSNHTLTVTNQ